MSQLKQAVSAIKAGDKETGRQLLQEVLDDDPMNENAWLWMAKAASSRKEKIDCLRKVLQINPDNEVAQLGLEKLQQGQPGQVSPPIRKLSSAKPQVSGLPVKKSNNALWILAGTAVFLFAGCCVFFLVLSALTPDSPRQVKATSESGQTNQQPAVSQQQQVAPMGQDVKVGDVRWKVLEARELGRELKSDNQFVESKTTSGRFIQVRFEIENQGAEPLNYGGVDILDDKGRTFNPFQERFYFIPDGEECLIDQLNPNLSKVCLEIFELPPDAKGLRLVVGDLKLFGSDEQQFILGI
jgi:hypothetical protein